MLCLFLLFAFVLASGPESERRVHSSILVTSDNAQVLRGAEAYYQNCAVCHGDTAKGLDEARLAFPEDHQKCERCHRPSAFPRYADSEWAGRKAFSIGIAPALHKTVEGVEVADDSVEAVDAEVLAAFPNALIMYSYIKATMPRHAPSSLEDSTYLDITAFLVEANGVALEDIELTPENAFNVLF